MDRWQKHSCNRLAEDSFGLNHLMVPAISIYNQQKDLKLNRLAVKEIVLAVLHLKKIQCREASIYFVTKPKICQLHEHFFHNPEPTDCISFPIDQEFLGEIFVCPKVAIEYSSEHQTDPYQEVALYIIHGLLHLIGYDDTPSKRRTMRKNEKTCMANCKTMINLLRPQ